MATPIPTTPPIVTTSGQAQNDFTTYSSQLQNALGQFGLSGNQENDDDGEIDYSNFSDNYTRMLDQYGSTADQASKMLIKSIQAKRATEKAGLDKTYDNYKRGLQLLGIQHNDAQATPDLLSGHITQVEAEHQQKLQELDGEEAKALLDAQQAQAEGNIRRFKEKMDYIKDIKKEKNQALKDTYDKLHTQNAIADEFVDSAYSELMKLPDGEREQALKVAAAHYKIPLASLVQALSEKHTKKTTGSGGGYTALELRKLRAAGIDPKNTKDSDNFLYNGVSPAGEGEAGSFDETFFKETYDTGELFNMARKLGIPRKVSGSRQGEIKQLMEKIPALVSAYKAAGKTDTEIQAYFDSLIQ